MENKIRNTRTDFHAVDFMRQVRSEMTEQFLQDKQKYFDYLSKDTIAQNAKLKIERIPVVIKCDSCGHSFEINIKELKDIQCPECAHKKCTFISGKEYYIKDMEVI